MTTNNKPLIKTSLPTVLALFIASTANSALASVSDSDFTKQRLNYAKSELAKGNLQTAKGILLDLLAAEPEMLRVKAELAMAYYRLQDWPNAKQTVDELLASNKLPKTVSLNITRLKQKIEQNMTSATTEQSHKLFGFVQVSLGNDSNLGLTGINDVFSDNLFDPNVVNETELFNNYGATLNYDATDYYNEEPYQTYYIDETCLTDPSADTACQEIEQLIANYGLTATTYLSDGFIDQDGNFIPYSDILPTNENITDIFEQPISYNYNDAFWKANAKVSHQYLNKSSKLQWSNTIHMTSETAFELNDFDKSRIRYDSRLLKSLSANWLLSGQVYFSHLRQAINQVQTYRGIRPEISYFTPLGKFALRFDWLSKKYEVKDVFTETSDYHSQTLSWSNYFDNKRLLLNSSVRLAANTSDQGINDYHSKSLSLSALYAFNSSWDIHTSVSTTHFDFLYKPSVDVNKLSTTLSYRISEYWKGFATFEYNQVSQSYYPEDINRAAYQIGLSRYF